MKTDKPFQPLTCGAGWKCNSSTRQVIAILLAFLFAGNVADCGAQTPPSGGASAASIKHEVSQIPTGALIEVRFTDKSKLRGYLSEVEANGFSFKTGDAATGSLHTTAFSDVKSVKLIKSHHIPPAVWMAIGAGAVVIVVLIAGRNAL